MTVFAPRVSSIIYNFVKTNYLGGYYLLPLNACPIVPFIFIKAGIPFKLIDIEPETFCIDRQKVIGAISDTSCEGLLFIYSYGLEYDFSSFFKKIRKIKPELKIIEDKCLCLPSFDLKDASPFADITVYSTGYGKYVNLNYGGYAMSHRHIDYSVHSSTYDPSSLANLIEQYKNCFINKSYIGEISHDWLDNSLFDRDEDSYKNEVLKKVTNIKQIKERLNGFYLQNLPDNIFLKVSNKPLLSWRVNLLVPEKEVLLKAIFADSLFASSHYQPLSDIFTRNIRHNSVAQDVYNSVINLFNDTYFDEEKAKRICCIINSHLKKWT